MMPDPNSFPVARNSLPESDASIIKLMIEAITERLQERRFRFHGDSAELTAGLLTMLYALKNLPNLPQFINVSLSVSLKSGKNFDLGFMLECEEQRLKFSMFDFGTTSFFIMYDADGGYCHELCTELVGEERAERTKQLAADFCELLLDGESHVSVENHTDPNAVLAHLIGIP